MTAAGYRVVLADKGRDVVRRLYQQDLIDLLILDPDLPDVEESDMLTKIRNRVPVLPLVVHTYVTDYENHPDLITAVAFVEKGGSSIENLRQVVADILSHLKPGPASVTTFQR